MLLRRPDRIPLWIALCAKRGVPQVDPLDRMSGSHDAAVVLTVMKVERVAQLLNRFFQQSVTPQIIIGSEAVEL